MNAQVTPDRMVNSSQFLEEVDRFSKVSGCEYMDAVIHIAEKRGLEIETAASIVKSSQKAKSMIQESAENLNYITRTARLPL